jgi:hypothetical protein
MTAGVGVAAAGAQAETSRLKPARIKSAENVLVFITCISSAKISIQDLGEMSEIDQELLSILPKVYGKEHYEFYEVALIAAISQAADKRRISTGQCEELLEKSITAASKQKNTNVLCSVFFTGNEYHTVFSPNSAPIVFDNEIEIIEQLSLSEIADKLKTKYKNRFI